MKKIIGLLSLVTFMQMSYAQDFKKVQGILLLKKFDAAKIEYDKAVTKNASLATTPDGVYIKAVIYDGFFILYKISGGKLFFIVKIYTGVMKHQKISIIFEEF